MTMIYMMIGCSIAIALAFLIGFLWSIRSGQYDDTYTPSVRMLFDGTETMAQNGDSPVSEGDSSTKSEPSQTGT